MLTPSSICHLGLYTDESPGLKVDPVVVLVLSLVFIFSVIALHSTLLFASPFVTFYAMPVWIPSRSLLTDAKI